MVRTNRASREMPPAPTEVDSQLSVSRYPIVAALNAPVELPPIEIDSGTGPDLRGLLDTVKRPKSSPVSPPSPSVKSLDARPSSWQSTVDNSGSDAGP